MSVDYVFSITLDDEILTEIFSRTPAKTVGKFRCLSKTWQTFLSTSHFIYLHLSRNTDQQSLILLSETNSLRTIKPSFYENLRELDLGNGTWVWLFGSCNGLVLLQNQEKDLFLLNPTTLELFKLPSFKLLKFSGFGYDCFSHDYKIVTFSSDFSTGSIVEVYLYSVKLGVWRKINHSLTPISARGSHCGVCINGCLNWFIINKPGVLFTILAFDMATEVFRETDIALNCDGPRCSALDCSVFAYKGCLCVMVPAILINKTDDIWIMKEYGNANSWTRLGSLDMDWNRWMGHPLWIGEIEIVLTAIKEFSDEDKIIAGELFRDTISEYNKRDGSMKEMVVNGAVTFFRDGCSFVDSLVSLREFTSST